jgi:hypothetical protein
MPLILAPLEKSVGSSFLRNPDIILRFAAKPESQMQHLIEEPIAVYLLHEFPVDK